MGATGFNDFEAAKSVAHFEAILDLNILPKRSWNFDRACLPRKVFGFFSEPAVELWLHIKAPIQIPYNYFREGFALIFANGSALHCIFLTSRRADVRLR